MGPREEARVKCTRCRIRAIVQLRRHKAAFCQPCYLDFFRRQVERAITHERMFTREDRVLVAASGGKDSLALWDVLIEGGYRTVGLHLDLGIRGYSPPSLVKTRQFAERRGVELLTVTLSEEIALTIDEAHRYTRRPACSACGLVKRHYFNEIARERGFTVVATGHNLDDEAARLMGNLLNWQVEHLASQAPTMPALEAGFVKKVKPLHRVGDYEAACYAFLRGIDYVVQECPNSEGATINRFKELLNQLEQSSPGTKQRFYQGFLKEREARFASAGAAVVLRPCRLCGSPSSAEVCAFCRLLEEVRVTRARRGRRGEHFEPGETEAPAGLPGFPAGGSL